MDDIVTLGALNYFRYWHPRLVLSYLLIVYILIFSLAGSFEDLVYPQGEPDAVVVRKQDIELLKPRRFINDTIIDFYIK